MTLTTQSKAQILAEKSALDNIAGSQASAFRKSGLTWSQRLNMQTAWKAAHKNDNYTARRTLNDSILSDQRNIDRWYLESPEYAAIVAAEKAKADLIVRNDNAALQLWTRLNNQNIADEKAEIKRLEQVAEAQRVAAQKAENLRLELIVQKEEEQRIAETNRLQSIEDKETQRIEKSIPLLTTILPIGLIGLFLYSRTARK
mgnify:FL=1